MKYYFLVGYLPELQRDDRKIRFGLTELLGKDYDIAPKDRKEIDLVLLGRDIFIIEKILSGKTVSIRYSLYDPEFWRDYIRYIRDGRESVADFVKEIRGIKGNIEPGSAYDEEAPREAPGFITDFLKETSEVKTFGPRESDRLYSAYYDYVLVQTKNRLLRVYFTFERDLHNVVAAIRARQKGLNIADSLVGESELVEALGRSNAEDFGLGKDYPWLESLMSTDYPPQRQELLEQILWDYLDENAGNDPFHFNSILSYMLKLQMLEKKLALSEEQGMAKVRRLEVD